MELSKKDKKVAREVIEKGLQTEFAKVLNETGTIFHQWKNNQIDNRSAYHLLCKTIRDSDKQIASRYDRMTGSNYIYIIAAQLAEGVISLHDLNDFSEEVKNTILLLGRTGK